MNIRKWMQKAKFDWWPVHVNESSQQDVDVKEDSWHGLIWQRCLSKTLPSSDLIALIEEEKLLSTQYLSQLISTWSPRRPIQLGNKQQQKCISQPVSKRKEIFVLSFAKHTHFGFCVLLWVAWRHACRKRVFERLKEKKKKLLLIGTPLRPEEKLLFFCWDFSKVIKLNRIWKG